MGQKPLTLVGATVIEMTPEDGFMTFCKRAPGGWNVIVVHIPTFQECTVGVPDKNHPMMPDAVSARIYIEAAKKGLRQRAR